MKFSKSLSTGDVFKSNAKHKRTHQGNGTRSLPKKGKKKYRGQGK
jgi:hypothetical protein